MKNKISVINSIIMQVLTGIIIFVCTYSFTVKSEKIRNSASVQYVDTQDAKIIKQIDETKKELNTEFIDQIKLLREELKEYYERKK
jgi:hypothetical protein